MFKLFRGIILISCLVGSLEAHQGGFRGSGTLASNSTNNNNSGRNSTVIQEEARDSGKNKSHFANNTKTGAVKQQIMPAKNNSKNNATDGKRPEKINANHIGDFDGRSHGGHNNGRVGGYDPNQGLCGGNSDLLGIFADTAGLYCTNITCPTEVAEPACIIASSRDGLISKGDQQFNSTLENTEVAGTWVCRTLYHPITGNKSVMNACIDTQHALTTDTCGCCDGICPDPCACPCDLPNEVTPGTGVSVVLSIPSENTTARPELCIPAEQAVSMVASGSATCKSECNY